MGKKKDDGTVYCFGSNKYGKKKKKLFIIF